MSVWRRVNLGTQVELSSNMQFQAWLACHVPGVGVLLCAISLWPARSTQAGAAAFCSLPYLVLQVKGPAWLPCGTMQHDPTCSTVATLVYVVCRVVFEQGVPHLPPPCALQLLQKPPSRY